MIGSDKIHYTAGGGERNRAKYQTYTSEGGKIRPTGRGEIVLGFELALSKGNRGVQKANIGGGGVTGIRRESAGEMRKQYKSTRKCPFGGLQSEGR